MTIPANSKTATDDKNDDTCADDGDRQKPQIELEMEAGRKAVERHTAQCAVPVASKTSSGAANLGSFPFDRAGNDPVDTGITEAFAALADAPKVAAPNLDSFVGDVKKAKKLLLSSAEFVAGFMPPDYLIDGLMQRRYVYSLTAPTGAGKTCIALHIAMCVALGMKLAEMDVEKGSVLFFAGENPDDVRSRWIKLCEVMGQNPDGIDVVFMPGTPPISNPEIRQGINAEAERHGPFSLLIVDTSAAYFQGDDENSNKQLGDHARMMRSFADLPGGPSILVTCHPTKNPDMSNLVPRGGGAFLAEVDGNLVAIKQPGSMIVELNTHGKFRGPEFSPISFKIVPGTSDKLVDTKGRSIWTVTAMPITDMERDGIDNSARAKYDDLLVMMKTRPGLSLSEYAQALNWRYANGDLNKRLVQTAMTAMVKDKLVEKQNSRYWITKKARKVPAKATSDGVDGASNPPFAALPQRATDQADADLALVRSKT